MKTIIIFAVGIICSTICAQASCIVMDHGKCIVPFATEEKGKWHIVILHTEHINHMIVGPYTEETCHIIEMSGNGKCELNKEVE